MNNSVRNTKDKRAFPMHEAPHFIWGGRRSSMSKAFPRHFAERLFNDLNL
uniref:Uncharacterized protein n=1 Tax=Rhizophora mucronata TaxID=61149 RepID=A0A2P2K5P7_RHIMU